MYTMKTIFAYSNRTFEGIAKLLRVPCMAISLIKYMRNYTSRRGMHGLNWNHIVRCEDVTLLRKIIVYTRQASYWALVA